MRTVNFEKHIMYSRNIYVSGRMDELRTPLNSLVLSFGDAVTRRPILRTRPPLRNHTIHDVVFTVVVSQFSIPVLGEYSVGRRGDTGRTVWIKYTFVRK